MKTIIAYYSWSGKTEKMAELIAEITGGELVRIEPKTAYTADYDKVVKQAKQETGSGFLPEIAEIKTDISACDRIFIGTPNWWSSIAPPVRTFLKEHDLAGKTVYPFISHGGGGGGHIAADIKSLCADADVKKALAAYEGSVDKKTVKEWI